MRNQLVLGIVVVISIIAVGTGLYVWRLMSAPDLGTAPKRDASLSPPAQPLHRDELLTVTICYPLHGLLSLGTVAVKRHPDTQAQAREVLDALLLDQRISQAAVLKDIKLQELYLDTSGTAYLDLGRNQQKELRASTGEELLAAYALVNTLMLNFDEIKQVFFLLDGKEALTLAGHVDLSRKFTKRMDMVRQ